MTSSIEQKSVSSANSSTNLGDSAGVSPPTSISPSGKLTFSLVLLCLLGAVVSIQLTRIHVFVHTDPNYHSICAMSEGVNCETVAVSPYSVFAGLPVSIWGLAAYLVMGGLALSALGKRRLHPTWPFGLLLLLASFSVAISAVLAFISATRIDSFCLFCMGSYAINVGLLFVSLVAWRQTQVRAVHLILNDAKALAARPIILVVLASSGVVTLGALLACGPSYWRTPGWSDLPTLISGADENGHHWIGAQNPRLTIIEFSDYQCPHCRAAHKATRVLAAKYPNQVQLIHRHLPLDMACHPSLNRPFHTRACLFAEAAECAGLQERFWEMNDALFSIQETVKTADVDPVELAVRLGLNRSDFKHCLEDHTTAERIAADVKEGIARKLTGTPSFLIGEQLFLGKIPDDQFQQLLETKR